MFNKNDAQFHCHGDSEENIAEFGQGCGCGGSLPEGGMVQEEIDLLNLIQSACIERHGPTAVFYCSCGYRCQTHNDRLPGSVPNSEHVRRMAADCIVPDCMTVDEFAAIAIACGAGGVGLYWSMGMVHVDCGERRNWTEND